MARPLLAILLLLAMIAETSGKAGLEEVSNEAPDAMQKQFCLIGEEIRAKIMLERRFKSMGISGAAGKMGDERRSFGEKEQTLLKNITEVSPQMSVPKY